MIVIQLSNVSLVLGAHPIFENLNWSIQRDQKIGFIGPNGAGKSSLFKIIVGQYHPEPGGAITRARGITIGYLAQEPELDPEETAFNSALKGQPRWLALKESLERVEVSMSDPQVYSDVKALGRAVDQQQRYLDEYLRLGGEEYPGRVEKILRGLGLAKNEFHKPVSVLSGGQRKLVGLARLLLAEPDVLLLDEPDNHLDLPGKAFLEDLIRDYSGAVVIVSHDRYLLDAIVTHIVELEDGKLSTYSGDYSSFILDKEDRLFRQNELFRIQQREIARLEAARKRYALWLQKNDKFASRMHAIDARLERMEKLERPVLERRRMGLELNGYRGSTKVVEVTGLHKAFDSQVIFRNLSLLLRHGERLGVIGPNGAGKSVLFRMILGQENPDAGKIVIGPSITLGYYAQQHETLNPEQSLMEAVRRAVPPGKTMSESDAVAFLNRYLFPYRMVRQPIKQLSGGERSRLQLALLVLSGANFLLLDEPTNNLDIASAEVLENALEDFEGSLLVISHDRYFLDQTVERILEIANGECHEYLGNFSDYAALKGENFYVSEKEMD